MSDRFVSNFFGDMHEPRAVAPAIPWFDDLVRGMGSAPRRLSGVVHARIPDDGGVDFDYRVVRDGHRVRCSALDGAVHVIANESTVWFRDDGSGRVISEPVRNGLVPTPDDYEFGTRDLEPDRWKGDDFARPLGERKDVSLLGRPAWRITLAPPPHKPEPMHMVVDRETHLVLREGDDVFFHEWLEIDLDPVIDDQLFTWRATDRVARMYQ